MIRDEAYPSIVSINDDGGVLAGHSPEHLQPICPDPLEKTIRTRSA